MHVAKTGKRRVLKRVGYVGILVLIGLGFSLSVSRFPKSVPTVHCTYEGRTSGTVDYEHGAAVDLAHKELLDSDNATVRIVCWRGKSPKSFPLKEIKFILLIKGGSISTGWVPADSDGASQIPLMEDSRTEPMAYMRVEPHVIGEHFLKNQQAAPMVELRDDAEGIASEVLAHDNQPGWSGLEAIDHMERPFKRRSEYR